MYSHNTDNTFTTVGERTVALKIIARCSITQLPTGQLKVWWWHARKMVVIYSKRILIHCFMANSVVYELRSNFWQAWNQSLHKEWETTINAQRRYGRMSKITGNWLNTVVFGYMELYNRWNVAPTESFKMSEHNIFLLQPFEHQPSCKCT